MATPFIDFGGEGSRLLFLHANGYPPACYRPLLDRLASRFHVQAMLLRPLWPGSEPAGVNSWRIFSEDLLGFLDEQRWDEAVVIGHSLGATTALRAALVAPERFRAMVLLDPVLLPRRVMLAWLLVRTLGLGRWLHPNIRATMTRRRRFTSLDEAFDRYRPRPVFRYLSDEYLRALIQGWLLRTANGSFMLDYSPEWEARVYDAAVWNDWDLWAGLPRLQVPALVLRGADSDTFLRSAADEFEHRAPGVRTATVDSASHLLPLERPLEVAAHVERFLRDTRESRSGKAATPQMFPTDAIR